METLYFECNLVSFYHLDKYEQLYWTLNVCTAPDSLSFRDIPLPSIKFISIFMKLSNQGDFRFTSFFILYKSLLSPSFPVSLSDSCKSKPAGVRLIFISALYFRVSG